MRQLFAKTLRLCLLLSAVAFASAAAQAQQVRIVHIDVGQGDATLIIGPTRTLLYDAGVTGSGTKIRSVINSLGLTSVDYFVAGHYHADHIGAIDELINGGTPVNLASYDRGGTYSSQTFNDYVAAVGAKRTTIALNQQIDLGGGCVLTCVAVNAQTAAGSVAPTGENDRSVALVLRFGTFDYFIASDLTGGGSSTADVESLAASAVGDVDVLHVGHHGSTTSTNQTLVNTLKPQQAVISCGDGNSYNHPVQTILDRLGAAPTMNTIWQTELGSGGTHAKVRVGGDITFLTNGTSYSVTMSSTGQTFNYSTDGISGGPPPAGLRRVVINEVAWVGSVSNSADEWIELFNTTASAIDLTGWRIVDDAGAQTYNLSGSIPANGYFLIERASTATSVAHNLLASGLSLANTGDSLELKDSANARVDIVNSAGAAWAAGTTSGYYTMERINPSADGDNAANWATNNGVTRNGTGSGGLPINGTPKAKNSATP
ncbi:MAG TPA: lamin tail domain-containing protein [Pyrinomonadaceae bacterium]|nr:lamin tail domain-containing protein [Pyrinomonadaceae bacterium]